jgi:hypothetical protein
MTSLQRIWTETFEEQGPDFLDKIEKFAEARKLFQLLKQPQKQQKKEEKRGLPSTRVLSKWLAEKKEVSSSKRGGLVEGIQGFLEKKNELSLVQEGAIFDIFRFYSSLGGQNLQNYQHLPLFVHTSVAAAKNFAQNFGQNFGQTASQLPLFWQTDILDILAPRKRRPDAAYQRDPTSELGQAMNAFLWMRFGVLPKDRTAFGSAVDTFILRHWQDLKREWKLPMGTVSTLAAACTSFGITSIFDLLLEIPKEIQKVGVWKHLVFAVLPFTIDAFLKDAPQERKEALLGTCVSSLFANNTWLGSKDVAVDAEAFGLFMSTSLFVASFLNETGGSPEEVHLSLFQRITEGEQLPMTLDRIRSKAHSLKEEEEGETKKGVSPFLKTLHKFAWTSGYALANPLSSGKDFLSWDPFQNEPIETETGAETKKAARPFLIVLTKAPPFRFQGEVYILPVLSQRWCLPLSNDTLVYHKMGLTPHFKVSPMLTLQNSNGTKKLLLKSHFFDPKAPLYEREHVCMFAFPNSFWGCFTIPVLFLRQTKDLQEDSIEEWYRSFEKGPLWTAARESKTPQELRQAIEKLLATLYGLPSSLILVFI